MLPVDEQYRLLDRILAGTPARLLDLSTAANPVARRELDDTREALASLGLALSPVAVPTSLRNKVFRAIQENLPERRRKALVVLDMLVDHLGAGGCLEVPRARAIVPAVQSRIAQARRDGDPVVYLCDRHSADDPELDFWGPHDVAGSPGSEVWPELAPQPGDLVLAHRTYSAFFETELESVLRGMDVGSLVVTGCITELGLMITAADALMRGFEVEVPPECQAGSSPTAEKVALATLSTMRPLVPLR